jgi:hypothetical protein
LETVDGKLLLLQTISYSMDRRLEVSEDLGTAALMSVILPAMRMGLPIHAEATVSAQFLQNAQELQEIFATWLDEFHQIEIIAPSSKPGNSMQLPSDRGTGSWFSLGVDGFHTLNRHKDSISDLVFMHGFDIDVEKHAHRIAVQSAVEFAAREVGKQLITLQSNARTFADAYLWWGHYCGSMLGAGGQLLAHQLRRIYWASSATYETFVAFGTNALTDPLFSSETMEVIHDGAEVTRLDKVFALAKDEFALQHLRVCWNMEGTTQNCGRCDKCLRTMTALYLADALHRAPTFPQHVDLDCIRRLRLGPSQMNFLNEHAEKAQALGLQNTPLMKAWQECALRSGSSAGAELDETFLKSLTKNERDILITDLRAYAPEELSTVAATYAPRLRREVFDFLWNKHRGALWRSVVGRKLGRGK